MRRAALAFLLLALAATGCGNATQRASGVVVSVDQASLTDVRAFTLRTEAGEMLTFRVGDLDLSPDGFPANHLREHMAMVSAVVVDYTNEGAELVAVHLTDAP